jgi:hypothetical protein
MAEGKKFDFDPASLLPKLSQLGILDLPDGTAPASEIPTGPKAWYRYAFTYMEAADQLVKLAAGDTYLRNILGPPALFLYRHSIELHLKSLLLDAGQLLDDPQTVPPKHYLDTLWQKVRGLLLKIEPNSEDEWVLRADGVIKQFDDLDPTSFAFRYPVGTDGAASLPTNLLVDLEVVAKVMSELNVLLDGASNQISVYKDYKQESSY